MIFKIAFGQYYATLLALYSCDVEIDIYPNTIAIQSSLESSFNALAASKGPGETLYVSELEAILDASEVLWYTIVTPASDIVPHDGESISFTSFTWNTFSVYFATIDAYIYWNTLTNQTVLEAALAVLANSKALGETILLTEIESVFDASDVLLYTINTPAGNIVPGAGQPILFLSFTWRTFPTITHDISLDIYPNTTAAKTIVMAELDELAASKGAGETIFLQELEDILNECVNDYTTPSILRFTLNEPTSDILTETGQTALFSYTWYDYSFPVTFDVSTDPLFGDLLTDASKTRSSSNVDYALESAVLISLFTDKRANKDSILPSDTGSKRGWWGDQVYPFVDGDQIGSHLWLLERSKTQPSVLVEAKRYIKDALQWMIDDKIVLNFDINVERFVNPPNDRIDFNVILYKTDGTYIALNFDNNFGIKIE